MTKESYFQLIKNEIEDKIQFLNDKPEETVESTIKALWFSAVEIPKSAVEAVGLDLPELTETQMEKLSDLINLRLNNTPLAHITGRQNFMGLELLADKRALIPRKETEILGKKALELSKKITGSQQNATVIDVCCGSGNLGLAIAYFNPETKVYLTDLSFEAVDLTRDNIKHLNLGERVISEQGDFLSAFEKEEFYNKVDLIVCNPPYISTSKVTKMHSEISMNEPVLAFDGGMLGIKIIQKLISDSPRFLKKSGWVIFEIGVGQGPFIIQLLERSENFTNIDSVKDEEGNIRTIFARRK